MPDVGVQRNLAALMVGALVGVTFAPQVLNMMQIQDQPGFGMDDIIEAAVIVGSIWAADQVL